MHTESITLQVSSLPRFIKTCPRCKHPYYENSGCFRVNANGKRLDIWLICRCEHCKTIWNLSVYERIDRTKLQTEQYDAYIRNDHALILQHVFDPAFLQKNRAVLDCEGIAIQPVGTIPPEGTAAQILATSDYPLPLPAGRVIALLLNVSLSRVRRMQNEGTLLFNGDLRATKAAKAFSFTLLDGWNR